MSLINEVLKDLDKKGPSDHQNSLDLMVSGDSPTAKRVNKSVVLVLILLALIAAAALVLAYQSLYGTPTAVESMQNSGEVIAQQKHQSTTLIVPQKPNVIVTTSSNAQGAKLTPENTPDVDQSIQLAKSKGAALDDGGSSHNDRVLDQKNAKQAVDDLQRNNVSVSDDNSEKVSKRTSSGAPSNDESSTPPKAIEQQLESAVKAETKQVAPTQITKTTKNVDAGDRSIQNKKVEKTSSVTTAKVTNQHTNTSKDSANVPAKLSAYQMDKQKTKIDLDYEKALTLYRSKQYAASERTIDSVLSRERSPRYLALKTRLLYRQGPQTLIDYIDQENLDVAISDEVLALSANAFQRQGDHLRALKAYDLLVQRQPSESKWWMAMGVSLETLQAYKKAEKTYSMALETGQLPANARAFTVKQLNKVKKALAEQQRLAEEQQ
jgi:hypothetical protein